jgi:hypothetical protein
MVFVYLIYLENHFDARVLQMAAWNSKLLDKFVRNRAGNFGVITALVILPILAVGGGLVIDVSAIRQAKTANQDSLDSALLAAVKKSSETEARKAFDQLYKSNLGNGETVEFVFSNSSSERSVKALTRYSKKNAFSGLFGNPVAEIEVRGKAVAQPVLTEMRIKPEKASGTFRKMMRLMDIDSDGKAKEVVSINYHTTGTSITGTMQMNPDTNDYFKFSNPREIFFTMDIDKTSAYAEYVNKYHLATNDPETSHHLFVDKKQLPKGTAVNIADYVKCGDTQLFEWEDGGEFANQDFSFKVTGKCAINEESPIALVD